MKSVVCCVFLLVLGGVGGLDASDLDGNGVDDRVCFSRRFPCGTCVDGEYEQSPCLPAKNRVCRTCSSCEEGKYEFSDCLYNQDRVCKTLCFSRMLPCTQCSPSEYEESPCLPDRNRVCRPCSVCPNGKFELSPCTNTTDRECKTLGICIFCPPGYFCEDGGFDVCPEGTTSLVGTLVRSGCFCKKGYGGFETDRCALCRPGYYKTYAGFGSCIPCDAGKFSPVWGSTSPDTCQPCPQNTSSLVGSGSLYDCVCNQGYHTLVRTPEELSCKLCQRGTYANLFNMTSCVGCPQQTYSITVGSSDFLDCLDCPAFSENYNNASTECFCNVGYSGPHFSSCEACPKGTYKNVSGMQPCVDCPNSTYNTLQAMTVCVDCRPDSQSPRGTVFPWQCQCNLGYELLHLDCSECEPGSYKPEVSNGTCLSCPADTFLAGLGSFLQEDCERCPTSSNAPERSVSVMDCQCNVGFYTVTSSYPFSCLGCIAGTYNPVENATACESCGIGKYSTGTSQPSEDTCEICPDFTSTYSEGSDHITDCKCNEGYFGEDGVACQACPRATYKPERGDLDCTFCPNGKHSNLTAQTGEDTCQGCPEHSWSYYPDLFTVDDCLCNKGFAGSSGDCSSCGPGTYKDAIGDLPCVDCPVNTYSTSLAAVSNGTCLACTPFSTAPQGSQERSDCRCNRGYEYLVGTCQACSEGRYKDIVFNSRCVVCPRDTYNPILAATRLEDCLECANFSSSPNGTSSVTGCLCDPGYYGPAGGPCQECHDGFVSGRNFSSCVPCPPGTYGDSLHLSCIPCEVGTFANTTGMSRCLQCPMGSFTESTNQSSCALCPRGKVAQTTGSSSSNDCVGCEAGLFQPLEGMTVCEACYAGSYSLGGAWECVQCSAGSISAVASDRCYTCPNQTFDSGNQTACLPCLLGSYSWEGWTSCDYCEPGYFLDQEDFRCKGCGGGTYVDPSLIYCELCPLFSTSEDLAADMLDCRCNLGYERTEDTAMATMFCTSCDAGTTHDDFSEACRACDAGSYAPVSASTTCLLCEPGRYQNESGMHLCRFCPFDTYMPYPGASSEGECIGCPSNSSSGQGSPSMYSCECVEGYSYSPYSCDMAWNASYSCHTCDPCALGYFKPTVGNYLCSGCDYGTFTDDLASPQCFECEPGEYNPELAQSSCALCQIGTYSAETRRTSACEPCPSNSSTYSEASLYLGDCECLAGYSGTAELLTCRLCTPGYWKDDLRDGPCKPCPFDTFSTGYGVIYEDNCTSCPLQSISNEASDDIYDCRCNRGYARLFAENCSACPAGSYKDMVGNLPCEDCAVDFFQNLTAQDFCYSCDVVSLASSSLQEGSASSNDCVCDQDFELIHTNPDQTKVCRLCVGLAFKNEPGDQPCTVCEKSLSIAQRFFVANYSCRYACEEGYIDDGEQCTPRWWPVGNNPWYSRLLGVKPHNFNSTIEATLLVRYNPLNRIPAVDTLISQVFPAVLVGASPVNCSRDCVPQLEGMLKPSSMSATFQNNFTQLEQAYLRNRMDISEEGYRFMTLVELNHTSALGELSRTLSLNIDRSYVPFNCESFTEDSVRCTFYIVVMFVRMGVETEYRFYNFPVTFVETHGIRIEAMQHMEQDTISFAGFSAIRFPGNVYLVKLSIEHGLYSSVDSMVLYSTRGGLRIHLDYPVCHYLGPRPGPCEDGREFLSGTVVDWTWNCSQRFPVDDAWVVLQLTRERFDSLVLSVLLEDNQNYRTFAVLAAVNPEQYPEMCKPRVIVIDPNAREMEVYVGPRLSNLTEHCGIH